MDRKNIKNTKKRICLIYDFLSEQGGLEREIIIHANFLKDAGYDITVLTCHLDKKILTLLPFDGLDVKTIGKINTPFESLNLFLCFLGLNNIKKYKPDAFLSYSFPSNFLIRKKKVKKINYVNHFPHFLYLNKNEKAEWADSTQGSKRKIAAVISIFFGNYLRKLDKKLIKSNNLLFMNSNYTKRRLDKLYNVKSVISYPPLDSRIKNVKKSIKKDFIFSSSRIIPDKKYEWLIESIAYMKNKLPLFMAGSVNDSYKEKLEKLASNLKVEIKFLGRLKTEEIRDYYSNAKVFAFPAPKEDFGLVPAESLACGTPVIAWNDGAGPTEQIIDGINGYLAKPYDLKDYAGKIDKCLDNGIKIKNKKKIIDSSIKFSYKNVSKEFIKNINNVIS